ncbi:MULTISPECIES: hypothetical protein [Halococcus]|uniref:DUF8107 domain-containing protein n=1 Tax=Halococcus salifodinae DSM 8989 TaxID=1227456 RepID=M0MX70_9EURY|nr:MULTISPECIES: hypothetical protein [Halococcus]EMA49429.1 hypothetical protein C450_17062 [Halococcus salifodinae DSM 8989]
MASQGDIRVLLVMDLLLSGVFSAVAVWGLSVVGLLAFSWPTVGLATLLVAMLTYIAVLR